MTTSLSASQPFDSQLGSQLGSQPFGSQPSDDGDGGALAVPPRRLRSMVHRRRERSVRWQPESRRWSIRCANSSMVNGVKKPREPIEKEMTGGIASCEWQSVAISGNQSHSVAIGGNHLE